MPKPKIIILGGGFGGVRCALDLEKFLPEAEIFIVDKNLYHTYTSDLYELSTAEYFLSRREDILKLASTISIPFAEIFRGKRTKFLEGEILNIDFKKKEVRLEQGRTAYDYLILALGSQTNFFQIPHLSEHALELKSAPDALNLKSALEEIFQKYGKHEKILVVIGGGGFTGSELAGELAVSLPKLARRFSHPVENLSLILVEGSGKLLGSADPWFHKKVKKRLESLGVKIMLESFITDIQNGMILLKNKTSVPYHLLIWTAGVKANRLVENLKELKLEKNKCIMVGKNLEALGLKDVFVIGDLAYCPPATMTAQAAIDQGHYLTNFLASKLGGRPYRDYHPSLSRFIVPLGGKYALADLGFMKISGFIPWLLKRFVALKYFLSILPPRKAFRLWRRGLKIFTRND